MTKCINIDCINTEKMYKRWQIVITQAGLCIFVDKCINIDKTYTHQQIMLLPCAHYVQQGYVF